MRTPYKIGLGLLMILALYETWAFTTLMDWELFVPSVVLIIGLTTLLAYFFLTFTTYRTRKPLLITLATIGALVFGFVASSLLLELIL